MMWRSRQPGLREEALLAAVAKRLRGAAEVVKPRPDFRSSLRTSLLMEAATALGPGALQSTTRAERAPLVRPRRRMVIAAAFVATALGLGGMASASASALPGDALYPVKRAAERVELTFHRGNADRGTFRLELAERRLDEARQLSDRGPESAERATDAVREFETAAAAGTADLMAAYREDHARTNLVVLNRFTKRTHVVLSDLASRLPEGGTSAVTDARDQLEAIDSRSEQLCPNCGGSSDESSTPPAGSDSSDGSDGSVGLAPAPESEPEEPPSEAPPVTSPSASLPSDEPADNSDAEDQSDNSDAEDQSDAPTPTPTTPEPIPTATTPAPIPTPTEPTPEPTPTPTPEPGGLLDIIPGVGELLGATLGGLL